jgi:integrase
MATITKIERKDGFVYRVQIRRDGKYLSRNFARKRDADAFARQIEGNLESHKALLNPELRRNTLGNLLDRYIGVWTGRDTSTVARLAWWQDNYGTRALAEFSGETVREGLERLRGGKVRRHQRGQGIAETDRERSPATINRYLTALGGAFRIAIARGWFGVRENPAHGIGREPEHNDRHGRRLSEDEREALLMACDASASPALGLIVRLALATGMRRGEILGLRWPDVDLAQGLVQLRETKNGDLRLVPLVPDVRCRLTDWSKVRRIDSDLVFASPSDPQRPYNFTAAWLAAVSAAGVWNFRFHDCRHSAASFLTDAGVNHVVIAEILGHRTLQMVQRYSHAGLDAKREALEKALKGRI